MRKRRKPIGRPTKLTPEIQDKLVRALQTGMSRIGAAAFSGIGESTFFDWMAAGARDDASEETRRFRRVVLEAEAVAELTLVHEVKKADPKWLLSRRYKRWAERVVETKHTHQGPGGRPLELVSSPKLDALLEALEGKD